MADFTPETLKGAPPPHLTNGPNHDMSDDSNSIFFAAVKTTRMPMIVTDPNQPDNPIVCGSAWKRDPGSGVIGVEKGPLIPVV